MLRCLEAHTVANTRIAAIPAGFVNGAFGLELLLKALRTGTGNPTGGHDLKLIFDGLPKPVQWEVLIAYAEYTGDAPEIGYLKILAMAKAFETWRYLYEDLSLAQNTDPHALNGLIYGCAVAFRKGGYDPASAGPEEKHAMVRLILVSQNPKLIADLG